MPGEGITGLQGRGRLMVAACIIFVCVLALVLGIVRVWQVGVEYGDRRRMQEWKATAMVADELMAQRQKRKGRAA